MLELMTIQEVAKILRVDETTVRRWCASGVIESHKLPKNNKRTTYRIKRRTVTDILGETSPLF